MNVIQRFERRTRRFRLTLLLSLFFAFFLMNGRSQGEPDSGAEKQPEAAKGVESPAVQAEGDALSQPASPPASQPASQPVAQPAKVAEPEPEAAVEDTLQRDAVALLKGLSGHISKDASAADAELEGDLLKLSNDAGEDPLSSILKDPEEAGVFIHRLRRRGLVPAKGVRFIGPPKGVEGEEKEASKAEQREVLGVVALEDGRSRLFKLVGVKGEAGWKPQAFERPTSEELGAAATIEGIIAEINAGKIDEVWEKSSPLLKEERTAAQLKARLEGLELLKAESFEWGKSSDVEGGYRVNGVAKLEDGRALPFFVALLETDHGLALLSIQETTSIIDRITSGRFDTLDISLFVVAIALILAFLYILFSYGKGLGDSPRELYLLFFTKVMEYSAYGAAQLAFMFYLREDIGLSDIAAGSYYSAWSVGLTLLTMCVGAICDAIGIKRTLMVGVFTLLIARLVMPFSNGIVTATIFGFIPMAFGIAITGPVLSVGIKRYTTIEGAALGFGLFYTLMNVGWAVGAWLFDFIRTLMGDQGSITVLGDSISTYQVLLGIGFFITLPNVLAVLLMRRGVEMTETGVRLPDLEEDDGKSAIQSLIDGTVEGIKATAKIFGENFVQRAFWIFILLISVTVFARLTFFHFHITWPSYGLRYFGQGSLIGNIFGVLNPVMIVFLVPVIAYFTRKIRSYWMLLVGTLLSVGSIFFVVIPPESFAWMVDTWFGNLIFERWLEVPDGFRDPYYLSMVLFVSAFTFGEAVWSPRLMQFTAEIAPPGREGSYISLAYLPYFGAKFIAGPMAGLLLSHYSPEFGVDGVYKNYPDHQMIWWWVGGTAFLTPLGLVLLRRLYKAAEERAEQAAKEASEKELAEGKAAAEA